jgi:hypothetical protein
MRLEETVLPPRTDELARRSVEAEDRSRPNHVRFVSGPGVFAAMKDEHVVMRVNRHAGNLAKDKSRGELRPTVHDGIRFRGVRSEHQRKDAHQDRYGRE